MGTGRHKGKTMYLISLKNGVIFMKKHLESLGFYTIGQNWTSIQWMLWNYSGFTKSLR